MIIAIAMSSYRMNSLHAAVVTETWKAEASLPSYTLEYCAQAVSVLLIVAET